MAFSKRNFQDSVQQPLGEREVLTRCGSRVDQARVSGVSQSHSMAK
jgi:hypothetical protein